MSRIPIARVLAVTEYTSSRRTGRIGDAIGMLDLSGGNPLEKIGESTKIRVQQVTQKGPLDQFGLRDFEYGESFRQFLGALSISWVTLCALKVYCQSASPVPPQVEHLSGDGTSSVLEGETTDSTENSQAKRYRGWMSPNILRWPSLWRPTAHIGPLLHRTLVRV